MSHYKDLWCCVKNAAICKASLAHNEIVAYDLNNLLVQVSDQQHDIMSLILAFL